MPGPTEPTNPDTEPTPPDTGPTPPYMRPTPLDTGPTNRETDPPARDAAPTDRASQPTDTTTDPTNADPAPTSRDPAPTSRGPAPRDHGVTPSGNAATSSEPAAIPSEPAAMTNEQAATPSERAAAPRDDDRAPSEQAAAPSEHAAVPRGHGVTPSEHAAAPSEQAAEPGERAAEPGEQRAAEPLGRDPSLERLVLFSDAVFAIAITLLALDLRLPEASPSLGGAELMAAVLATWPHVVSYAITFAVIGAIWIGHLRLLQAIVRCDTVLLGLNLLLLGTVGLLPFHTALLGGHFGDPAAALFYSLGLVLVRLAAAGLWWYAAAGRRLLDPALSPAAVRGLSQRVLLGLGLSVLGALVALLDPTMPKVLWLLAGAVPLIRRRSHRPRRAGYTTRP